MKKQITFNQLKKIVKESMEPFGDFDYPEWMDDVEYHKGQKPDVAQVLKDLGWSVAVDDEKIRATPPSWGIDITFHEGDKVMQVIGDAYSLVKRTMEKSADAYYLGQAFEEIKGAVEMTMRSPLDEGHLVKEDDDDKIDLQFSNQVLKRMEKLIDQGKDQLGNLERNPRKIPVTFACRLEITQTMKEIRRLAHLIVDQMKD